MVKKHIPNFITLLNLTSGALAAIAAVEGRLQDVVWFVLASALFDFADGLVARALKVKSDIGKELDSLADVVSFGLVPGLVVWQLLKNNSDLPYEWLAFSGLFLPALAAYRLAKFNLDTRQSESFLGVPTPAMALFFVTLPLSPIAGGELSFTEAIIGALTSQWLLLLSVTILFSLLMISELPLLALKFKNIQWRENIFRYILIGGSGVLLLTGGIAGLPLIVVWYIALSVVSQFFIVR